LLIDANELAHFAKTMWGIVIKWELAMEDDFKFL